MNRQSIKVITFDLDDTLWHTAPVIAKAEQAVFDWLSDHAPLMAQQFTLAEFDQVKFSVYEQHPELTHQISQVRIIALQQALQQSGYNEVEAIDLATQAFAVFLEARHQVELFDDTLMMLEQLHPQYQLGVLTNGNADISRLDIGEYFDFAFSAEQLNSSKPAAGHFQAAMKTCDVSAEEIIHIGDHPEHDMAGALAAGCHAIWYNPAGKPWLGDDPAPLQAQQISDIPRLIAEIQSQQKA